MVKCLGFLGDPNPISNRSVNHLLLLPFLFYLFFFYCVADLSFYFKFDSRAAMVVVGLEGGCERGESLWCLECCEGVCFRGKVL